MPETTSQFRVVFEGDVAAGGEMDVRDLAPALLALGNVFTAANEELNGDRAKSSVRVQATGSGSFFVVLDIWVNFTDVLASFFDFAKDHHEGIVAANDLVDLIAKIGGGAAFASGGLLAFLKWLRGRKPEKVEEKKDGTVVVFINEVRFITNKKVLQLAESLAVRESVEEFSEALEKKGVQSIRFEKPAAKEPPLVLTPEDAPALKVPDAEEEVLLDEVRKMALQIISLSFKPDNKWRFFDGESTFTAAIEDENFLKEVANNERAFAKGDTLICDVHIKQYRTPAGVLKQERTIVKVREHIQAARQLRLL